MLGKMLKYEFKATSRILGLVYAAVLALACINTGLLLLNDNVMQFGDSALGTTIYSTISGLMVFLYVLMVIAAIVVTIVIIVVRFYRMYGNEGYLWHTLPLTANQHILAKLIVAFVWNIVSFVVVFLSIWLLLLPLDTTIALQDLTEAWDTIALMGLNLRLWLVLFLFLVITGGLSSILMFYAAIAIGPTIVKSRLGGTVLAYLCIYVGYSMLNTVLMVALGPALNNLALDLTFGAIGMNLASVAAAIDQMVLVFCAGYGLMSLALVVVFYVATRYFTARKLNLP